MKVGLIGVGKMGSGIGMNILNAGHDLVAHDIRVERVEPLVEAGASQANSPRELAQSCEVVFTSLPGPQEVEEVALGDKGLLEGMQAGKTYFDLTTNSPTLVRRIHKVFLERGVDMLDAPVSGGPWGAASGRMAIWIGGDKEAFEHRLSLLQTMGDEITYLGPSGAGVTAKLVHNCTGFVLYATLAETFSMGIKAGLEPDILFETLRKGMLGRRPLFDCLVRNFLPSSYDAADFDLELAVKDVRLATELGAELDVPMQLANYTLAELKAGVARGWGEKDARASMLLQLERAGLEPLKVSKERIEEILNES